MFSLIIPVYKNEANVPTLLSEIAGLSSKIDEAFEAIFVVDGSPDLSHDVLVCALPSLPYNARVILLTKNEGSFVAIRAGLNQGQGCYFGMLAADLQEPVSLIADMYERIRSDKLDVVIATRARRDDPWLTKIASSLFWRVYRKIVMPTMPPGGFDTFVCTRGFRDQLIGLQESRTSLVAQILWLGGRLSVVSYHRRSRSVGVSAWTLRKKISYLSDSIFSFTNLPIQLLLNFGGVTALASAGMGVVVLYGKLSGQIAVPGYSALALLVTFFGSSNLFALGIVGNYAWRTYENTKKRPAYTIRQISSTKNFNQQSDAPHV